MILKIIRSILVKVPKYEEAETRDNIEKRGWNDESGNICRSRKDDRWKVG